MNSGEGNARGGFYSRSDRAVAAYAQGGLDLANRHQAEYARGGTTRVWREPETMGESYIPHANDDRRPRAMAILDQTAGLFGGQVTYNARGNYQPAAQRAAGGGSGGSGVSGPVRISGTLNTPWGPSELVGTMEAVADRVSNQNIDAHERFRQVHGGGALDKRR